MTQRIKISMPDEGGAHEAHVAVGGMNFFLSPGESMEAHIYKGQEIHIVEVPEGTKARVASEALAKAEGERRDLESAGEEASVHPVLPVDKDADEAPTGALDNSIPNRDNPFTEGELPKGAVTLEKTEQASPSTSRKR